MNDVPFQPINRRAIGGVGENAARAFLEANGYRWIASNHTTRWGELDLVVEKDGVLVIVEVKRRTNANFGAPEEAVSLGKQRRMVRAALSFVQRRGYTDRMIRFDVVTVGPDRLRHIPNAFEAGTDFYY